jgi:hypothetical protein
MLNIANLIKIKKTPVLMVDGSLYIKYQHYLFILITNYQTPNNTGNPTNTGQDKDNEKGAAAFIYNCKWRKNDT